MSMETLQEAVRLVRSGLSVIPIKSDGSKRPPFDWSTYMQRRANEPELHKWFADRYNALGAVCGAVSGNLEVIDFDDASLYPGWCELVEAQYPGLLSTLPTAETPRGGMHVHYRAPAIQGNLKLAERQDGDNPRKRITMIETRGEGGQVVSPPTPGSAHPSGKPYVMRNGDLAEIPILTQAQRDFLLAAARSFSTIIESGALPVRERLNISTNNNGSRPGDAFAQATDWAQILEPHGWTLVQERNGTQYWKRPGTTESQWSATVNHNGYDGLYVFSANAQPFEPNTGYQKFHAWALLNHGGDYKAAAAALRSQGYGAVRLDNVQVGADTPDSFPYTVQDGRLTYLKITDGGAIDAVTIADFDARIVQQAIREFGGRDFRIHGQAGEGQFTLDISAEDFSDSGKLRAALVNTGGSRAVVRARMIEHLRPAIQMLSHEVSTVRKFDRTGWHGAIFLIPGREPESTEIALPRKLPYEVSAGPVDLELLRLLCEAVPAERALPVVVFMFQAAIGNLAGWRGERYGIFNAGRSGTFKTSWTQCAMAVWGPGFMDENRLLKWGEGATRNAIMGMATRAHDMPFLIDNYKPSTGEGPKAFINLIHNIVEGSEKDRMTRTAELRDSRPIYAWPVMTGEDVPDRDPASLARILINRFDWPRGIENPSLTALQNNASGLQHFGAAWLTWLEGEAGRRWGNYCAANFGALRDKWGRKLRSQRADMVNVMRVASNLASNQLTYLVLSQQPEFGSVFAERKEAYEHGLVAIAKDMAAATAESLEASRYLAAVRELLTSGKYYLGVRGADVVEPDRLLGYREPDGTVFLLPLVARKAVEQLIGVDGLGNISQNTLNAQLKDSGKLASVGKDQVSRVVKINANKTDRLLHLTQEAIEGGQAEIDELGANSVAF